MLANQLNWNDKILCEQENASGSGHTQVQVPFQLFYATLFNNPILPRAYLFNSVINCSTAGSNEYVNAVIVPTGAIIKYAGLYIQDEVIAGGTSVKIALAPHGDLTNTYVITSNLSAGITKSALIPDTTPLASPLTLDVCCVTTAGSALGNTPPSSGFVRVVVMYLTPTILES
jgi:hypothetical protein